MWVTHASRKTWDAKVSAAAFLLALLVALVFVGSSFASGVEQDIRDNRDTLRIAPASGEIAIVEIDGRSLQALDQWPWPRSYYADAIERLDELGAEQIAFDVDFSARSSEQEDERLAEAVASISQPVILPTFRQRNQAGATQTITEALPIPELREGAFLASVNVYPSADGHIRYYPNGVTTNGTARPSLANMLAKRGGEVDDFFRVDQAIDPATIPRISFVDLLEGKVERAQVAGKRIVFGATAIELGDRYPTALFGVQPGVVVQSQAAETLLQDRARAEIGQGWVIALIAVLLVVGLVARVRARKSLLGPGTFALSLGVLAVGIAVALDHWSLPYLPLAGSAVFLVTFSAAHRTLSAAASLEAERLTDTASGIANRAAMDRAVAHRPKAAIAVARMADFMEVMTVMGSERLALIDREIVKRLRLLAGVEKVYRLEGGLYAWIVDQEEEPDPNEIFAAARALFTAPFELDGERLRMSAHFGLTTGSIDGAVLASTHARNRGLIWSSNSEDIQESAAFKQRILSELDDALGNGAMSVVFQPKLRLVDQTIASAECLVRWNSPQLGHIPPADFIPILEGKNRIDDLTRFVLSEAIRHLEIARGKGKHIELAINVSAQLLSDDDFVTFAVGTLEALDRDGDSGITIEITESAPLVDSAKARQALEKLCDAGARISIDDYGTGQATLNYLQGFPAHELKLDQSFVRGLTHDHKDRIMVQSTLELAHALEFEVVAEGVEDQATLDMIAEMGCDYAQGWHIGRPMQWSDLWAMLDENQAVDAAA